MSNNRIIGQCSLQRKNTMMMRKSNHSLYHATVTKFNLGTPSWKEVQGPLSSFSTHGEFTLSIIEKKQNKIKPITWKTQSLIVLTCKVEITILYSP